MDGDTYTIGVVPTAAGAVTVSVAADAVTDAGSNGNVASSASVNFVVDPPPTLSITPNTGSTSTNPIVFTFQFSEVVTGFEAADISVVNGSGQNFSAVDGDTYTIQVVPTVAGAVTVSVAADAVTDAGSNGNAASSASVNFAQTAPPIPVISPMPAVVDNLRQSVSWPAISGAVSYEVWFARVSPSPSRILTSVSTVSTTTWTPPANLDPARYRVWVRSQSSAGIQSAWSAPQTFEIRPKLLAAHLSEFSSRPTLTWESIPNASGYQVYIRTSDTSFADNGNLIISDLPATATSYTPSVDLPGTSVRWWIRASDFIGNNRGWSDPGVVELNGRARIQSATSTNIAWGPVTGASRYILHIASASGTVVIRQDQLTSTAFGFPGALPTGTYRAWVKAIDSRGGTFESGVWSRPFQFTVAQEETSESRLSADTFSLVMASQLVPVHESAFRDAGIAKSEAVVESLPNVNPDDLPKNGPGSGCLKDEEHLACVFADSERLLAAIE
ncbi:MAG: Ig-like domain-containing protein [Planctomycetaceae bacterium]